MQPYAPVRSYLGYSPQMPTTIQPSELHSRMDAGFFGAVIDVRTVSEWNSGHIPNATFIENLAYSGHYQAVAACKQCNVATYCKTGVRAEVAAATLEAAGFSSVFNALGVSQWASAGYPLVQTASVQPPCAVASGVCTPPPPLSPPQSQRPPTVPLRAPPMQPVPFSSTLPSPTLLPPSSSALTSPPASTVLVAAITIPVAVLLALAVAVCLFMWMRRQRRRKESVAWHQKEDSRLSAAAVAETENVNQNHSNT